MDESYKDSLSDMKTVKISRALKNHHNYHNYYYHSLRYHMNTHKEDKPLNALHRIRIKWVKIYIRIRIKWVKNIRIRIKWVKNIRIRIKWVKI